MRTDYCWGFVGRGDRRDDLTTLESITLMMSHLQARGAMLTGPSTSLTGHQTAKAPDICQSQSVHWEHFLLT